MNRWESLSPLERVRALEAVLDRICVEGPLVWFQGLHLPSFAHACDELVAEVGS